MQDGYPSLTGDYAVPFILRFDCPGVAQELGPVYLQATSRVQGALEDHNIAAAWIALSDRFLSANLGAITWNPTLGPWFDRDHRLPTDPFPPGKPGAFGRDRLWFDEFCGASECF